MKKFDYFPILAILGILAIIAAVCLLVIGLTGWRTLLFLMAIAVVLNFMKPKERWDPGSDG